MPKPDEAARSGNFFLSKLSFRVRETPIVPGEISKAWPDESDGPARMTKSFSENAVSCKRNNYIWRDLFKILAPARPPMPTPTGNPGRASGIPERAESTMDVDDVS